MSAPGFEAWKTERVAAVTAEQGDLALVALHDITMLQKVPDVPGMWAPADDREPGLLLQAEEGEGLQINGRKAKGRIRLEADQTIVRINRRLTATATFQPGSLHLLAVWDEQSPAMRQFAGIDVYPYDERLALTAYYTKDNAAATFDFAHTADAGHRLRTHESPGRIGFTYNGKDYAMRPFVAGDHFILVFRDETSSTETYGMGRMLLVPFRHTDGKLALDFNYAFLPPCAFSSYFNCPMPPADNRLDFAVRAGEKHVISSGDEQAAVTISRHIPQNE